MKRALTLRALTLTASLILAACTSVVPAPPPPPVMSGSASATVGIGGQAMLNGLVIRPIAVTEDSRCPINARCVWAGRLILRTDLSAGGWHEQRDLTLGTPQPVPGGTLTLTAAEPGKLAGAQANPPANRFTFELVQ